MSISDEFIGEFFIENFFDVGFVETVLEGTLVTEG